MTEEALIQQLKRRERSALDTAIDRYGGYVAVVAGRVLGSTARPEDLEEILSDVFLSLWQHAGDLREGAPLRPWLAQVARNRALNWRRGRVETCPIPENKPDPAPGPEELAQRRETAQRLLNAVESLDEPDRTLFLRYYYQDEPLKEVARDMGLNLSTAKTRLARGRKKLKAMLAEGGAACEAHP